MVIISACLCGIKCRYDGRTNEHPVFIKLLKSGKAIPICPEQLGGLGTPREAAEIAGGSGEEVLNGQARVVNRSGEDVSPFFIRGAEEALHLVETVDPKLIILKSRSPSCAVAKIYDGSFSSRLISGHGVTAALLSKNGYSIMSDEDYLRVTGAIDPLPEGTG